VQPPSKAIKLAATTPIDTLPDYL